MTATLQSSLSVRPRRLTALALALALALLVAAPGLPVRAEIVDFDPSVQDAPELLTPPELDLLGRAMGASFVYMLSDLSPTGAYVQAYVDGVGLGFIGLADGELVPLQGDAPGYGVTEARWVSEARLAQINQETIERGGDQPPLVNHYRVTMDAATGDVVTATFDVAPLDGDIVSAGPGLGTLLVMKLPEGSLAPREVELSPTFGAPPDGAPDGLPGLVGSPLPRTLQLQQSAFSLALVAPDGSDRRELASLPTETAVAGVTWSDDGRRVAVVTQTMPDWQNARPRRAEPIIPGTPNLGSINVREALGVVPPLENPLVVGTRAHVFDVATGRAVKTFDGRDYLQGMLGGVQFGPTDAAVLVIATRSEVEGRPQPIYSRPAGLEYRLLDADLDVVRRIEVPGADLLAGGSTFLGDGSILFVVADETDNRMVRYDPVANTSATVWDEAGAILQFLARGDQRVFSHSTVRQPWDLWTPTESPGGAWQAEPLTTFGADAGAVGADLAFEDVSWRAPDGATLHGIYVHAADTPYPPDEPGPLVVWQMGGPGGQMTNDYGATVETPYSVLPHFDLPVLIANAAGRTVQSPEFRNAMVDGRNFGQLDIAQIKAGVDHLVREGVVHPERVGITGCSYGGYFTLQSLRTYPDVYAAGNPQCSLVDLTEEFTFGYTPLVAYLEGRAPMADPAEYLKDSPMYGVKDVDVPVLIFHGQEDFLPVSLLTNIHDDLDARGVEVKFLRVAGEGHGFGMPASQSYAAQEQILFFRRHLIEAEVGPPPPRSSTIYLPSTVRLAAP